MRTPRGGRNPDPRGSYAQSAPIQPILPVMIELQSAANVFGRLSAPSRGIVYMIGSGACFAAMIAIVRYLSTQVHTIELAFFRNLFGLAFMVPWIMRVGLGGLRTKRFGTHLFRSLAGLAAMLCFFTAIGLLPVAEVTALTFTAPLFASAGAALILKERVRLRRWTAIFIGFAGALIILRPGAETIQPAALIALASAGFMAIAVLSVKALSRTENPNAIVVYMGMLITPLSLIPALFVWTTPPPETWGWLVLMGLVATMGQVMLARACAAADASVILPFDFARLVFVAILGFALFGERPDIWTWVGAALIISATVYVAHRESRLEPPI